jgi:uncharacterized membrane protein YphA (DoxX/SURF4 family)
MKLSRNTILSIITYLFILLFVYAAANKILDFQKFKVQIGQSPILTDYAVPIAWIIPNLEIVIAIALVFGSTRLPGLYASFALMVLFTAYIVVVLNFSEHVPCSCGGILEKMNWRQHLVFNLVFVLLALARIVIETKSDYDKISLTDH